MIGTDPTGRATLSYRVSVPERPRHRPDRPTPRTHRATTGRPGRAAGLVLALLAVLLVATAPPAGAHQPIFIDDGTDPHLVPIIEDGTVSFAVYGTVHGPDRVAAVRAHLSPGDTLATELLIPATGPETGFAQDDLPWLTVIAPDGTETPLLSTAGERFDEPFSQTSYVRLARLVEPALDGIYQFEVRADRPSRFTLVIGQREVGGRVIGYAGAPPDALATWYAEPPPDAAPPPATEPVDAVDADEAAGDPTEDAATPLSPGANADGSTAPWWIAGVVVLLGGTIAALGLAGSAAARRRDTTPPG